MPTPPETLVFPSMAHHQQFQQAEDQGMRTMRTGLLRRYRASSIDQVGYEDQPFPSMNQYQLHNPSTIYPNRRSYMPPPVFPSPRQSTFSSAWSKQVTSAPASQFYTASPHLSLTSFLPIPQPQPSHMSQPGHLFNDGLTRCNTSPAMGNQVRTGSLDYPHHQISICCMSRLHEFRQESVQSTS